MYSGGMEVAVLSGIGGHLEIFLDIQRYFRMMVIIFMGSEHDDKPGKT